MKLNSRSQVPPAPNHFRYVHPISGREFIRHGWDLLRGDVTDHTKGNNYPPVSDEEIERQMCENMGDKAAKRFCAGDDGMSVGGVLHWRELVAGTQALLQHTLNGRQTVPPEEAERRAGICATCPRNSIYAKPCGGDCPEVDNVIVSVVGGGKTSIDDKLEACSVCGCVLRALVWVPGKQLSTIMDADFIEKAPEKCWKRDELVSLREKVG